MAFDVRMAQTVAPYVHLKALNLNSTAKMNRIKAV